MVILRFVSLLLLAIWVGGAAVLGAVGAPTIFSVLETQDPATGRVVAGQIFGAVLTRFHHLSYIVGGLFFGVMIARAALGPRPRRLGIRLWIMAAMIAASVGTAFYVTPRIDQIRTSTAGAVSSLPDNDPRKQEFGRLHGLSNVLMLAGLLGGVGLIWAEMKDG